MHSYLYAIGDFSCGLYEDELYIGVTTDPVRRWNDHSNANSLIGGLIRSLEWTAEENMILLYFGETDEVFSLENFLRPTANMGLNVAMGGHGGYTSYSEERNTKISKSKTGQPCSKETRDKIKNTISKLDRTNENNGNSKKWLIESPSGEKHLIHGTLISFCKERNLTLTTLRKYNGIIVPEKSNKARGTPDELLKRSNTTGWKLTIIGD